MKEDIKILEDKDLFWNYSELRVLEAIEHLLQAYNQEVKSSNNLSMLNAELAFKLKKYEEQIKEDKAVIEELVNYIIKEKPKLTIKKFMKELKNKVKGEKE